MTTLQIELPDEVRETLALSEAQLSHLALEALLIRLYERGELSSHKAAQLLGIPFSEFLARLGEQAELDAEFAAWEAASDEDWLKVEQSLSQVD
ncbi:MAG: UPF0175 family protein [Anaerolineae bacterium]